MYHHRSKPQINRRKQKRKQENQIDGWDLGAQTAKGLSSNTTEEVVSETLVHKFVITATTSDQPSKRKRNKRTQIVRAQE